MNVFDLIKIYPNSLITNEKKPNNNFFTFFDGTNYLNIPIEILSRREQLLLETLSVKEVNSIWYDYLLLKKNKIPRMTGKIKIIQFKLTSIPENREAWLSNFKSYFKYVHDAFFIKFNYGILILQEQNICKKELEDFLLMMNDDFSSSSNIFIGVSAPAKEIRPIYEEEYKIFLDLEDALLVTSTFEVYLQHYLFPNVSNSSIADTYKLLITEDSENIKLIYSMWESEGNISSVSERLYIHRNTVIYRIEKLLEKTGLDIRKQNELLIAYIFTLL